MSLSRVRRSPAAVVARGPVVDYDQVVRIREQAPRKKPSSSMGRSPNLRGLKVAGNTLMGLGLAAMALTPVIGLAPGALLLLAGSAVRLRSA